MPDQQGELMEAENLLRQFERSITHEKRTRNFDYAINLLNDYVEENPSSSKLKYIENIKTSYTRILLEQLYEIKQIEIDDWFNYFISCLKVKSEVTKILSENPILKEGYEKFTSIWKEEVLEYLTNLPNSD